MGVNRRGVPAIQATVSGLTCLVRIWYALVMAPDTETEKRNDAEIGRSPTPEAFPWERLPGESAQAYRAFSLYRALDPKIRAYDKVGDHSLMRRWANRFRWATRVAEWEAFIAMNQADLNEAGRLQFRSRSLSFASRSLAKAERSVTQLNETKLSVEDVNSLASEAVRIGRVALDLPPDGPVRQLTGESTGLSVSLPSVPWLAAFIPQNQTQTQPNETKPNEVVPSGEQVLDETPPIPGRKLPGNPARKRLVNRVLDYKPDDLAAPPSNSQTVKSHLYKLEVEVSKSHLAKQGEISPKETALEVAPPNKEHPYRRCKKHGNSCRRGGHN